MRGKMFYLFMTLTPIAAIGACDDGMTMRHTPDSKDWQTRADGTCATACQRMVFDNGITPSAFTTIGTTHQCACDNPMNYALLI